MKIRAGCFVSPKSVDIDHRKGCISGRGNFDLGRGPAIVDEVMGGKQLVVAFRQASSSKRPKMNNQSIGSCASAFGANGHAMSGWIMARNGSTSFSSLESRRT